MLLDNIKHDEFQLNFVRHKDIVIAQVIGSCDIYIKPNFILPLQLLLDKGCKALIVDFSKTKYIDSTGIGCLIQLFNEASEKNAHFSVSVNPKNSPDVSRVLTMAHVKNIIPVFEDVVSAVSNAQMFISKLAESE